VQAAFHQRLHHTLAAQLGGARGGGVTVRHVLDVDTGQAQPGLGGHRFQPGARPHQQRLDQAGRARIQRAAQAQGIAGVDHGHSDRAQGFDVVQQARQAAGRQQPHLGQGGGRALDLLLGRLHQGLALDRGLAILVHATARQRDATPGLVLGADGDADRESVAHAHRRAEFQCLAQIDGAGAGQPRAEHGRDQRAAPHAMGDDAVELGGGGVFGIEVGGVHVTRHHGEQRDVLLRQLALDAGAVTDLQFIEGAVAQDPDGLYVTHV